MNTPIKETDKEDRVLESIASWITPGMKINGLHVVPKTLEISTIANWLIKDSFACKNRAVRLFPRNIEVELLYN